MTLDSTAALIKDASLELDAFWKTPEADIIRTADTHILVLVDQRDPHNHPTLRRLGCTPNLDPEWSRWTTLVLPKTDFGPPVRQWFPTKRAADWYPIVILAEGQATLVSIPDPRAKTTN